MTVFHTPRCRIVWTDVMQGNTANVAVPSGSFALKFGLQLDPAIWFTSGFFTIHRTVLRDGGELVADWPFTGWTATDLGGRPSGSIWISKFFWRADQATNGRTGVFLFRPRVDFQMWGPGGSSVSPIPTEFAVAEEDHYFVVR